MLTGRVREFPENSLQNYLTELSQYLEQSQRREELPQTNEEIMIRRKDGAIRKGRFWGFAFDSIIIHHDTTLVNYLFKDIAEIEATDGEYLEVRKLQDQLQARQLPIYSSMVLQTEDSVAAINLAKVDSLGWHKDFRKAGMVIGGAADLATLAGFILFMRPIFSGPILGSASVQ